MVEPAPLNGARASSPELELTLASGDQLRIPRGADALRRCGMMLWPASVRLYVCLTACDMRRSFDGLHALVRDHLKEAQRHQLPDLDSEWME